MKRKTGRIMREHFHRVAGVYRGIRVTDPEPVEEIKRHVHIKKGRGMDLGCGTGRYSEKVLEALKPGLFICADLNQSMLTQARKALQGGRNFKPPVFLLSNARKLPIENGSLDFITTFNAVHHFKVARFLKEAARILKPGGWLFVYTRTPRQNRDSIWGKFFPQFCTKEKRLWPLFKMRRQIRKTPGLKFVGAKQYVFGRATGWKELRKFAVKKSYSTFSLYRKKEFVAALRKFKQKLQMRFSDLNRLHYTAENILYLVRKT
ncbi:MAG: class I SAM-dependent methyltransferase [candidate division Zixibacteria bacterium]|nr:class I SAM-dependent methyltransferase [candidate division Zixibacteria bacterium]